MYYASVILILLVVGSQFPPAYKEINLKSSRRAVIMASNFLEKDSDADPMVSDREIFLIYIFPFYMLTR